MTPIIKWCGGKSRLLPMLRAAMPEKFGAYCEPFAGGAALFFNTSNVTATRALNDLNAELIGFYRVVRDKPFELIEACKTYVVDEENYYAVRDKFDPGATDVERASQFLYLNKCGFNGLYRVNAKGQFNVPWGKKKPDHKWFDPAQIEIATSYLLGTRLTSQSYLAVTARLRPGDFCYLDPPYDTDGDNFAGYTANGFGEASTIRLLEEFNRLSKLGVYVLMSNAVTDRTFQWMQGRGAPLCAFRFDAPRAIGAGKGGSKTAEEFLFSSYPLEDEFFKKAFSAA